MQHQFKVQKKRGKKLTNVGFANTKKGGRQVAQRPSQLSGRELTGSYRPWVLINIVPQPKHYHLGCGSFCIGSCIDAEHLLFAVTPSISTLGMFESLPSVYAFPAQSQLFVQCAEPRRRRQTDAKKIKLNRLQLDFKAVCLLQTVISWNVT